MELFQSNAQLVKEKISESPDVWKYKLYSVTMTDHTHYVAEEFNQTVFALNSDGHYDVSLRIKKDENIDLDRSYLKPVLHIIDLVNVPLSASNATIEVNIIEGEQQKGDKRILHTSTADEDGKPL